MHLNYNFPVTLVIIFLLGTLLLDLTEANKGGLARVRVRRGFHATKRSPSDGVHRARARDVGSNNMEESTESNDSSEETVELLAPGGVTGDAIDGAVDDLDQPPILELDVLQNEIKELNIDPDDMITKEDKDEGKAVED